MPETALQLAARVGRGQLGPAEPAAQSLARIRASDDRLHAFLSLREDAPERASRLGRSAFLGLPLAGVPVAIKDNLNLVGTVTSCGSRMLANYRSPYTATVVERLERAGAVVVGKTNLDEFAMGSSTENSAFGATRNPWDLGRVPGGSSGGSAAAVAGGQVPLALGSDTGGSVRLPAAFCGVLGFKPTYGRLSRYGLVAFASSLDQVGVLARSSADLAAALDVMCGIDPLDSTSIDHPPSFTAALDLGISGLRVGWIRQALRGNHPAVERAMATVQQVLEAGGARFGEADLPTLEAAVPAYYLIADSEASSNLARYDGMLYGLRSGGSDYSAVMAESRAEGFGQEVKRRVLMGTYALSSGYYDAYYSKAMRVRRLIARDFAAAFGAYDLLLCPTAAEPAFPIGERSADPLAMYRTDVYTVGISLAGLPALSLPAGYAQVDGKQLPVGIQLIAPALRDELILAVSQHFERVTEGRFFGIAPGFA
jgi:aspartyl-tRNA(Asn)/glutamyl-tRNA(Gln) amidotransferase subunit A